MIPKSAPGFNLGQVPRWLREPQPPGFQYTTFKKTVRLKLSWPQVALGAIVTDQGNPVSGEIIVASGFNPGIKSKNKNGGPQELSFCELNLIGPQR